MPFLLNADPGCDGDAVVARTRRFVEGVADDTEALIVTLLQAPAKGLADLARHGANAALWAFTQQAALEWAPRRIRVNAIGLGAAPAGPFEAPERAASGTLARPASLDDIARTIRFIAACPSMTGQIIRLGV